MVDDGNGFDVVVDVGNDCDAVGLTDDVGDGVTVVELLADDGVDVDVILDVRADVDLVVLTVDGNDDVKVVELTVDAGDDVTVVGLDDAGDGVGVVSPLAADGSPKQETATSMLCSQL